MRHQPQRHKQSAQNDAPCPRDLIPSSHWQRQGCSSTQVPEHLQAAHGSGTSRSPPPAASRQHDVMAAPAASSRLTVAEYASASADVLQEQVQLLQDSLCACQTAYDKARAGVVTSTTKIQQLHVQIKSLQEEDAQLSARLPLPINRLCRVRQWLAGKVAALDAEQAALEGKQMDLLQVESRLRAQETECSLLHEAACSLDSAAAAADAAAQQGAAAGHDREAAAARRQLLQMQAEQQQAERRQLKAQQQEDARDRAAAQCQGEAARRLGASLAAIEADAAAAVRADAAQHSQRWQSLAQLKAKVDEAREGVARSAEKKRQLRKQKAEQQAREFEALQEQGLNPYEVYRVRSADAAAAKAARQLQAVQQRRRAALAAALAAEEQALRKQHARAEFDRQVEVGYQRQMGIAAQQQRTDAYMRSHTVSKQALLDPTSRVPVHPSEAVLVKPAGFGLGRASPEALAKVAARHGGVGTGSLAHCLLLPRRYRSDNTSPSPIQRHARHAGAGRDMDSSSLQTAASWDAPPCAAAADGTSNSSAAEADAGADHAREASGSGSDSDGPRDVDEPSGGRPGGGHAHRKPLRVAQLSKYEAERLQQAKQRHKAQLAQPKAAFGRVFAGDAFLADPPALVFKDFLPGRTYRASVKLINRSFTGSSIRLLEVPAEVMHVLEVDMPPSGCLAPGACATLRATFTPQADEPLSASIPLLADTGPLALPFKALVRQALPSIDPCPTVSLDGRAGGVMLGASSSRAVSIANAGQLDVLYTITVLGPLADTTEYSEPPAPPAPADASEEDLAALQASAWASASLSVAGLKVMSSRGRVPGYGRTTFTVEFTPAVAGLVQVPVLVSFTAPAFKGLAVPPMQLVLQATGRALPVSTLTPVVDFKCVMFGRQYTAPLLLANAGRSAMKVLVAARPELSAWLTFAPDCGFLQADDTLAVSVSLKPTPDMARKLAQYLVPEQQDTYAIPLQVSVPGQPLPLSVQLRLQATTSNLHMRPRVLDFGRVHLTEAAGLYLTLTNPSLLPQCFSFGSTLPPGLKLSPNAGFGRVLPQESIKLLATFQPQIPGLQFYELTCKTTAGRVFRLEGKCDGVKADVTLSHNCVQFPATAFEDSSSASVVLRNTSSVAAHMFEFGVPAGSHVQVTPRVGLLRPNSSLRVQLDFSPPASLCSTATAAAAAAADAGAAAPAAAATGSSDAGAGAAAGGDSSGSSGAAVGDAPQQPDVAPAQAGSGAAWYREWLLPCFIRQAGTAQAQATASVDGAADPGSTAVGPIITSSSNSSNGSSTSNGSNSSTSSSTSRHDSVLHLSCMTCAVPPELHLVSPPGLPRPPRKNHVVLDFGALPVGERATKELVLQNTGPDVASLLAAPLHPVAGAFALVNALRPLPPAGGTARVLLAFSPPDCGEYQELLVLRSCKSRLRVCLRGRGIAPTLSVSPPSATLSLGGLDFGDVLLSDPVAKELKVVVTNTCPFNVSYSTRFIGAQQPLAPAAAPGIRKPPPPPVAAASAPAAEAAAAGAAPTAAAAAAVAAAAAGKPAAGGVAAVAAAAAAATQQQQQQQQAAGAAPDVATAADPGQPSGCFFCKPSSGVLQAGEAQELTVVFAPLGAPAVGRGALQAAGARGPWGPLSPYVQDRLQILVPHQQADVVVPLWGNAWPDGVFMAGAPYVTGSHGCALQAAGTSQEPGRREGRRPAGMQDPFAAIQVAAAAAAAAATAAAGSAGAGSSASGAHSAKGKAGSGAAGSAPAAAAAAAAASAAAATSMQQRRQELAAALAAAGYCDLTQGFVALPGPVAPGQSSSVRLEFGAVKCSTGSAAGAAAAGELVLDELPAEAKEAGWSVDPPKVSAPAGERRPLTIRFTAPAAARLQGTPLGVLGQLQLPVERVVQLGCGMSLKGGCQPVGTAAAAAAPAVGPDGSRRLVLVCSCVLAPAGDSSTGAATAATVVATGAQAAGAGGSSASTGQKTDAAPAAAAAAVAKK